MKIVLFPLRLLVGYGLSPRLLGLLGVLMLVVLRVTIGAHFLTEGLDKQRSGNWDSAPFFANAKGPFASHFHEMVWDHDGKFRLNGKRTKNWFGQFGIRLIKHYGFEKAQQVEVKKALDNAEALIVNIVETNADELREYNLGLKRIQEMEADKGRSGGGLLEQIATVKKENKAKLTPIFAEIESVWDNYEATLKGIATSEQIAKNPPIQLTKKPLKRIDTNLLNEVVPYFDIAIGACLLFGLFTPAAALLAAGFLGSVFLSSFPPTSGPGSTYYQLVEAMACLVLAATGAGRFGGLDYFLHMTIRKTWGGGPSED